MKRKMEPLARLAVRCLGWMVLVLFIGLTAMNVRHTAYLLMQEPYVLQESIFYRTDAPWLVLASALAAALVLAFWRWGEEWEKRPTALFGGVCLFALAAGALWLSVCWGRQPGDSGHIREGVIQWMAGDFSSFEPGAYFFNFPYQYGYGLLVEAVYRLFGIGNDLVLCGINVICIAATFLALCELGRLLLPRDTCGGRLTALLLFGAAAAVLYSSYVYGNVVGTTFSLWGLYAQLRWQQGEGGKGLAAAAVLTGLSILFKTFGLIFLVGQIILLVLAFLRDLDWRRLAAVLAILAVWQSMSFVGERWMESRMGHKMDPGTPMIATIAMGMQGAWEGFRADGWYNTYNRDIYEKAGFDRDRAHDMAMETIAGRVERFRNDPARFRSFYWEKTVSQWAEPTYEGLWISAPEFRVDEVLTDLQKSIYLGRINRLLEGWMDLYQSLVWLGAAVFIAARRKTLTAEQLAPGLIILGGFLFSLLWEGKSQYILPYFLLAIPYASGGLQVAALWLRERFPRVFPVQMR